MYKWSDFNINNNNDTNKNITLCDCPKCSKNLTSNVNTLSVNNEDKNWFCNNCGFAGDLFFGYKILPTEDVIEPWKYNPNLNSYQYEDNLTEIVISNFNSKGISKDTLKHFKIKQDKVYFPSIENYSHAVVYPYFINENLVNLVYAGKYRTSELGGVESCFNYDCIDDETTIISATELEVFSFYEAGIKNVISIFGGNSYENITPQKVNTDLLNFLANLDIRLQKVKKIILALPNNEISNFIKDELLRRIGKEKCWVIQPPQENYFWNDVLINNGKEKLISLLDSAQPIPIRGIIEVDDVDEQLNDLYYKGLRKGYSTGFDTVDQYYTVVPGQWTVMTGIPGHGKSNFLDAITVNLAKYHDWKFGIFSPENQPVQRHFASILEKYFEAPFDLGKPNRITESQLLEGKLFLRKHFSSILPHEDDSWSIDGILDLAKILVFRKGIRGLIIDPWNEIDHSRPGNQTETEYVSSVLTKIRQFARTYDVHVWLVAHPAKLYKDKDGKYPVPTPYDISGSAHYRNKADNAITVWRNVGYEDQSVADIHIQKIRFKEVGKVGLCSLRYDSIRGSFIDDIDQMKRRNALDSGEVIATDKLTISDYFN